MRSFVREMVIFGTAKSIASFDIYIFLSNHVEFGQQESEDIDKIVCAMPLFSWQAPYGPEEIEPQWGNKKLIWNLILKIPIMIFSNIEMALKVPMG